MDITKAIWYWGRKSAQKGRDSHDSLSSENLHTARVGKQFVAPRTPWAFCENLPKQQENYDLFWDKQKATHSYLVQRALSYYPRIHPFNNSYCAPLIWKAFWSDTVRNTEVNNIKSVFERTIWTPVSSLSPANPPSLCHFMKTN